MCGSKNDRQRNSQNRVKVQNQISGGTKGQAGVKNQKLEGQRINKRTRQTPKQRVVVMNLKLNWLTQNRHRVNYKRSDGLLVHRLRYLYIGE